MLNFRNKELQKFVLENPKLVTMRLCVGYPGLFILKYSKKCFYDNLWNDMLEECRGTIITASFEVVSRPFQKIYNYGVEARSPKLADDVRVSAFRKVNGFMVACTLYQNELLVSTTGSTDSPYVTMAKTLMDVDRYLRVCRKYPGYTFMFECCHVDDKHIVPEVEGMYLLGWRGNAWNSKIHVDHAALDMYSDLFGAFKVEHHKLRMSELLQLVKTCTFEGYVFYTAGGVSAKIKSPHYLVQKWMARNPNTEKLLTKEFKEQIDEEYYGLLNHIRENIDSYTLLTEQERLSWIRTFLEKQ